jgi:RNA polymerase sigma-70 factor (ECF subfamily)
MGEPSANGDATPTPLPIGDFVRLHSDRLYRIAYRLTGKADVAEDLVQEAFLDAHRNLHQLRSNDSALAWLVSILRRRRVKWLKGAARLPTVSLEAVDVAADVPDPPAVVDQEELSLALERLPDEFREPLILFYFEDLKYREIAEALETPIGTVMSRLARGKAMLRADLSNGVKERSQTKEVRDGSP